MNRFHLLIVGLVIALVAAPTSNAAHKEASTVRITATPTVAPGGAVTVIARVSRKATCRASLSTAAGQLIRLPTQRLRRAGRVTWRYTLSISAPEGDWDVEVSCGLVGFAFGSFAVKVPVIAPPQIDVGQTWFGVSQFGSSKDIDYALELKNLSATLAASDVKVTVTFFDASGASEATQTSDITAIPAGSTFYLSDTLFFVNVSLSVATMKVSVAADRGVTQSIQLPSVGHFLVTHEPELDSYSVQGQLTNPYAKALPGHARISLVYYDASNKIIGSGWLTTGAEVEPGATVTFTANGVAGIAYIGASVDPCGGFGGIADCDLFAPG